MDWLARPGGQLLGCYVLACLIFYFSHLSPDSSEKLLFLIVGAIVRDMQDARGSQAARVTNSPGAQITNVEAVTPSEKKPE